MKEVKLVFLVLALLVTSLAVTAAGNEYYVSKSGSDSNPGTKEQSWRTVQKAANTLTAGDTVYVRAGTYYIDGQIIPKYSGEYGKPITYAAHPGETVTLDGSNTDYNFRGLIYINQKEYIVIDGFRIQNVEHSACDVLTARDKYIAAGGVSNHAEAAKARDPYLKGGFGVLSTRSKHITIKNLYVTRTGGSGIRASGGSDITIHDNELNVVCTCGQQEGITVTADEDYSTGIIYEVDGFEIYNNYVHDLPYVIYDEWCSDGVSAPCYENCDYMVPSTGRFCPKEGIDAKVGSSNGAIHHNVVHGARSGVYIDGWDTNAHDIEIYNNLVYDVLESAFPISAEEGGTVENVHVYNNVAHSYGKIGFFVHKAKTPGLVSHFKDIYITNNVAVNNPQAMPSGEYNIPLKVTAGETVENLVVKNNIFDCGASLGVYIQTGYSSSQHQFDHNLYTCKNHEYNGYFGTNNVLTDNPKFVDEADKDFHLQSSSPAINQGTSVGAPSFDYDDNSRDSSPDIGAFEYGSVQVPDWDINQDGKIDILDLISIGQRMGYSGSPGWIKEDVKQDGTIDILDMILVAQHQT
ncbi:MAG: DUF1565 domain-containing protein [bacterium]|nr:DUF1565 domain-containing protein [bacterium]